MTTLASAVATTALTFAYPTYEIAVSTAAQSSLSLATPVSPANTSAYVAVGPSTTEWNYTPTQNATIQGVTTVTISPVPYRNATNTTAGPTALTAVSVLTLVTSQPAFGSLTSGWNATNSTQVGGMSNSASGSSTTSSGTTHGHLTNPLTALNVSAAAATSSSAEQSSFAPYPTPSGPVYGFEPCAYVTNQTNTTGTSALSFGKRQTRANTPSEVCTPVFATINGQLASWCNNWDGSTVVSVSTYTTTRK